MFSPPDFHPHRLGVVAPVRVDPEGRRGPTRAQSRGPAWRRTSRGLFVPSQVDLLVDQRIVEAAALLPAYGAVTGWAALHWCRARWFEGRRADGTERDVSLATGGIFVRPQRGVAICEEGLDPREIEVVDGLRVTVPVRSVCFEMRYAPSVRAATTVLAMAAYSDLVSIEELAAYALAHSGWTGIPRCRDAMRCADENCWSPGEAEALWEWTVEGAHPLPMTNRPVFDLGGRHLGTPDLIDPAAGVVGEYDGEIHLAGAQRRKDIEREAAFRAAGLECVTMMGLTAGARSSFRERLRAAYARAERTSADSRSWTLELPDWWVPTHTVAARRRLSVAEQQRFLRYRRVA